MSFHEKNAWACLLAVLAVYIPYFSFICREPITSNVLFVAAVVFLAVLLAVFHATNAIFSKKTREAGDTPKLDERDRIIDLKASKISGFVLGLCVIVWCINAMLRFPFIGFANLASSSSLDAPADLSSFSISGFVAIWWVQLLFAGFVFANIVYYATVIFFYRR